MGLARFLFKNGSLGIILLACTTSTSVSSVLDKPIQIALKLVEMVDDDASNMLHKKGAEQLVRQVNSIYSACQIHFKLEYYSAIQPHDYDLPPYPTSLDDMETFRKPFDDPKHLVIVKTKKWDHHRVGSANAWTAMPGDSPSGVIIEAPVVSFAGIVAHELGHYLSLYHVKNSKNLMNPMIYRDSVQLSVDQCAGMRSSALQVRAAALRQS